MAAGDEAPALEVHSPAPEGALHVAELWPWITWPDIRDAARKLEDPRTWRLVHGG